MSYLKTMTNEQLGALGFDISPDDPNLAISRLYPNLSVRHRCEKCGNWSGTFNGKCRQCFVGRKPLTATRQYYKLYTECCSSNSCQTRADAFAFLDATGIDAKWPAHDGFGEFVRLDVVKEWQASAREDFFAEVNDFSVSKYGARLIAHPDSNGRSKLPKKPK